VSTVAVVSTFSYGPGQGCSRLVDATLSESWLPITWLIALLRMNGVPGTSGSPDFNALSALLLMLVSAPTLISMPLG